MRGVMMDLELRSPSPRPSPPGSGRAFRRTVNISESPLHALRLHQSCGEPPKKIERSQGPMADDKAPSPGEEGRGQGERSSKFAVPLTLWSALARRRL